MTDERQYCTFFLDGHYFGIDVLKVQEVIRYQEMTRVPLAHSVVRGLINLRGQIVTAIDLRRRLGLDPRQGAARPMSVVVDYSGELYSLLVDEVGEVMALPGGGLEENPPTLDGVWRQVTRGIYRLEGKLMAVLDVERLLDFQAAPQH